MIRIILLLICAFMLMGASNVSYRCKASDGTWSVAACYPGVVVSPTDGRTDPQRQERLRRQREAYFRWCRLRDPENLAIERCVLDQMSAMAFIDARLRAASAGSQESSDLAQCIATFTERDTQLIDAMAARECYSGPSH